MSIILVDKMKKNGTKLRLTSQISGFHNSDEFPIIIIELNDLEVVNIERYLMNANDVMPRLAPPSEPVLRSNHNKTVIVNF